MLISFSLQSNIISIMAIGSYRSQSAFTIHNHISSLQQLLCWYSSFYRSRNKTSDNSSWSVLGRTASNRTRSLELKSHLVIYYCLQSNKHNTKREFNIMYFSLFLNASLQASDLHRCFSLWGRKSPNLGMLQNFSDK